MKTSKKMSLIAIFATLFILTTQGFLFQSNNAILNKMKVPKLIENRANQIVQMAKVRPGLDVPGFDADVGSLFEDTIAKTGRKSGRSLFLEFEDTILCYDAFYGEKKPTVFYLPCLNMPKSDCRSINLENWCRSMGYSFLAADYYGVGRSAGDFKDGTPSKWASDTIKIIEELAPEGKVVLVGSGVGGWIATLVAKQRKELVSGIVGLAADPDFTEDLLMKYLSEDEIASIMENEVHTIKWGAHTYPISKKLIEDGRKNLVLRGAKNSLDIKCPVRLVHGMSDEEVPFSTAVRLANCIASSDVKITLLKSNSHYLDNDVGFRAMRSAVEDCIDSYFEYDLTTPASG